jgi:hypothetical protein
MRSTADEVPEWRLNFLYDNRIKTIKMIKKTISHIDLVDGDHEKQA